MSGDPEILSATYGDEGFVVKLRIDVLKKPAYWGMALADIARHVASAHETLGEGKFEDILKEIIVVFSAEIEKPTDIAEGGFDSSSPSDL